MNVFYKASSNSIGLGSWLVKDRDRVEMAIRVRLQLPLSVQWSGTNGYLSFNLTAKLSHYFTVFSNSG